MSIFGLFCVFLLIFLGALAIGILIGLGIAGAKFDNRYYYVVKEECDE